MEALSRRSWPDDVVWHVPGRNLRAGDYRGKAAVLGYFDRRQELAAGTFSWDRELVPGTRHGKLALLRSRPSHARKVSAL